MFVTKRCFSPDDGNGSGGSNENTDNNNEKNTETKDNNKEVETVIDYEKLSSLIAGKQSVAEDQVLKGYFKQQGLSKEEADKAIADYKEKVKAETPDIEAMKSEVSNANQKALDAAMKVEAYKLASGLGIDLKAMEYVYKLADTTGCVAEGEISTDKLTEALNKVLEDVPAFKASETKKEDLNIKVGSDNSGDDKEDKEAELRKAFGL